MAQLIRAIKHEDEVATWRQLARTDVNCIVNYQTPDKWETPLFCASMKGQVDVATNLLEKGAKVELKTNWGATPLHAASERGHLNIVKLLVAKGSPLNEQTRFGDTPAHLAAYRGYLDIVKCLVEAGTDLFIKNSERRTILDEASVAENGKVVRYLEGVYFGEDTKPTPWQTPYSGNKNQMVTTNLNTRPASSSGKSPVGRSYSSPPETMQDKNRKDHGLPPGIRHKLYNLSFDEVVHHPTVRLSLETQNLLPHQQPSYVGLTPDNKDYVPRDATFTPSSDIHAKRTRDVGDAARKRDVTFATKRQDSFQGHETSSNAKATRGRSTSPPRPGSDGIFGGPNSGKIVPNEKDSGQTRTRSLEKIVTELQCGLLHTQEELERTKASLKAAKAQIDSVCAAQKAIRTRDLNNENRRLYLKLRDNHA